MLRKTLIFSLCLFPSLSFAESSCMGTGDYTAASIILIDGSDSSTLDTSFEQSLKVMTDAIVPKERIIAAVITDRRANAKMLIDMVRPEESIWESKLLYQKKIKDFNGCIQQILPLAKEEVAKKHDKSAILETLLFAKEIFAHVQGSKKLLVYSDMIQHSDAVSFYKLGAKDSAALLTKKVEAEKLQVDLPGVLVRVAGVGGTQNDKTARLIEEFWRNYFSKASATLEFYGPVLVR